MGFHSWPQARLSIFGVTVSLALLVGSCGGDSDPERSDISRADSTSGAAPTEQDNDADSTSASLHEALAAFPLPPGSEVPFPADEYDSPRATVVQFVSVPLPHMEVAKYLFAELPGAGYTIVDKGAEFATSLDGIDPEFGGSIYFKDATGVPGQVTLQVQGEKTGLNFNVFTADAG